LNADLTGTQYTVNRGGSEMIDFSISSTPHSEAFSEPATGFTVIRKVSKAYGTGAHIVIPVQHAGKRCIVVVLED